MIVFAITPILLVFDDFLTILPNVLFAPDDLPHICKVALFLDVGATAVLVQFPRVDALLDLITACETFASHIVRNILIYFRTLIKPRFFNDVKLDAILDAPCIAR